MSEQLGKLEQQARATVYMLQAMKILFDENSKIPNDKIMRCGYCKKRFLTLGIASAVITARACTDCENGNDTFDKLEPRIKECLGLLTDGGTTEQITDFVVYVADKIGYSCTKCEKSCWEIMPPKKK